jgi:hypothetical protein
MATARAETGLDDFGDDAFRQGLEGFALHQSIVRYEWDGERANGMMERSRAATAG